MAFFEDLMNFFRGSPEKHKRVSTLQGGQQDILQNLLNALSGQGAGGAYGPAADYFRSILMDNPQLMEQFFAPEMRQFNQETIPGLAEQFAGMGSGGLSSSGFRNAAINAGTDLQERLAQIRASLKQGAAQGLGGLGQQALGNYSQDIMTQPGTQGFLPSIFGGIGSSIGGPIGGALGGAIASKFGSSNPYANAQPLTRSSPSPY